jgi:hypothetical protein
MPGGKMSFEETLNKVEGNLFTVSEYDTLCAAAINGGLISTIFDPDHPSDDLPAGLMEWIHFCEYVRSANAILHMVLSGVLVPTSMDVSDAQAGYRYKKSDMADAIIENMGVGSL